MNTRRLLPALGAAAALTLAAPAGAATISAPACMNSTSEASVSGSGYAPFAPVQVAVDDFEPRTVTADAGGSFRARVRVPPEGNERAGQITATDGINLASKPVAVVYPYVRLRPRSGSPNARVRLRGRGLSAGRPVWLHLRRASGGRTLRRRRLVRRAGPCGSFDVRARLIAPAFARDSGSWRLIVSSRRRKPVRPLGYVEISIAPAGLSGRWRYFTITAPWRS